MLFRLGPLQPQGMGGCLRSLECLGVPTTTAPSLLLPGELLVIIFYSLFLYATPGSGSVHLLSLSAGALRGTPPTARNPLSTCLQDHSSPRPLVAAWRYCQAAQSTGLEPCKEGWILYQP